ncbi:nitric oxide reductase activation protein NorD [Candidatus Ruthia endofausta]|uniref:Nitric oxide reductase activation protein NorD n=1 Tax=Candidatus Ruthia endofausta TaxID=2738852 RepID=A0A6N0HPA6_9GAMM|nr:nitric oxide reductase activation protein NorD [Candidatus Ruthia endofausta]QKQ24208.1 nitric oxide reductase activation protein NorD [Candidatus Ruthia endofausta]
MAEVSQYQPLNCAFNTVQRVFAANIEQATKKLSEQSLIEYYKGAEFLAKIGQGDALSIAFLKTMPWVGEFYGDGSIQKIVDFAYQKISRTPNKGAVEPFLNSFIDVVEHTNNGQLDEYLNLIEYHLSKTTFSVHGIHDTHTSPSLIAILTNMYFLLEQLEFEGIYEWINYGLRYFQDHPERQEEYFSLSSADSKAVFQRQRKGLLFSDVEREINLFQRALWKTDFMYAPYSPNFEKLEHLHPYLEDNVIRLPDIYEPLNGVNACKRYMALVAHLIVHHQFTTKIVADNVSPQQRFFTEIFEDARVEYLAIQIYPGLKNLWLSLIPIVDEFDCDDKHQSCLRHRAIMLTRALLDKNHPYKNQIIIDYVEKFKALMSAEETRTLDSLSLGLGYLIKTRSASDALASIYFENTEVTYRDDNRSMWLFIEEFDEEDNIFEHQKKSEEDDEEGIEVIPPHYYDEWDYAYESYKPDWAAVYERLHSHTNASKIEQILDKHSTLVKQLKKVLDLLKPQNKKRLRFQEEGAELDLDIALRSVIDIKNSSQPDTRINVDFEHDSRSVSVLLLLDLSESLNEVVGQFGQTILELSQEAVSLLAWAVEQLGDNFAIAGFNSDTRQKVMYYHIKGYNEHWDDAVKARLADLKAEFSTRMGAAIRHGAHYLDLQQSDKKLMLILTDGEPADIDVYDPKILIQDTHKAVQEAQQKGMYPYCISLDKKADEYIADIFGSHYSVIDRIESLPQELPKLFLSLTK